MFALFQFIIDHSFKHLVGSHLVVIDCLLQMIHPRLLHFMCQLFSLNMICLHTGQINIIVLSLLFLQLLLHLVNLEIIVLILNLLPLRNSPHIVARKHNLVPANLFQILPLLFMLLGQDIPFWWFVQYCLCDSVYETSITSLLAYVDLPHLQSLLIVLIIVVIVWKIVLG